MISYLNLLPELIEISRQAGDAITHVYQRDFQAQDKSDGSPVTEADLAANDLIVAALGKLTPEVDIISEEGNQDASAPAKDGVDRFWLVDPLDGTRDFIKKNGEFCVCIALVEDGYPVMGVLHGPASGKTYVGAGAGSAAQQDGDGPLTSIACRAPADDGLVMAVSRSRPDGCDIRDFAPNAQVKDRVMSGSALKFAMVAAGEVDVYANYDGTSAWDTAAGQAVVEAAGGAMMTMQGARFRYSRTALTNPHFIATGLGGTDWMEAG